MIICILIQLFYTLSTLDLHFYDHVLQLTKLRTVVGNLFHIDLT